VTEIEIEKLKKELEEAKSKRDEYLSGWKRAKADFANYQKDEAKRGELMAKFAAESILRDLVVVLDSFDLAMITHPEKEKELRILKDQLLSILKKWGFEEMVVEKSQKFDPHFHEAVQTLADDSQEEGTILEVLQQGYLLHGRVLRPAKVKVAIKVDKRSY